MIGANWHLWADSGATVQPIVQPISGGNSLRRNRRPKNNLQLGLSSVPMLAEEKISLLTAQGAASIAELVGTAHGSRLSGIVVVLQRPLQDRAERKYQLWARTGKNVQKRLSKHPGRLEISGSNGSSFGQLEIAGFFPLRYFSEFRPSAWALIGNSLKIKSIRSVCNFARNAVTLA